MSRPIKSQEWACTACVPDCNIGSSIKGHPSSIGISAMGACINYAIKNQTFLAPDPMVLKGEECQAKNL